MKGWTPAAISRWEHHALEQLARAGSRTHADRLVHYFARRFRRVPGLWESQETIAEHCGWSRRSVQSWHAELQQLGVLDVEGHPPTHDEGTGRWTRRTNRYRPRFCQHHEKTAQRQLRARRRPPMRNAPRQYVPPGNSGPGRQAPEPVSCAQPEIDEVGDAARAAEQGRVDRLIATIRADAQRIRQRHRHRP